VGAGGGRLGRLRVRQVLYRPGRELVVRYDACVCWWDGTEVEETILAGTTVDGPPPGTLPVEADGMTVGVWRYPFDPFLPGLDVAVRPSRAAALLELSDAGVDIEVRTYRPTRRAVAHACWHGGEAYLKIVPPSEAAALVEAHERLRDGGVPVAAVRTADSDAGVLVLAPLGPRVLRGRLLEAGSSWPSAGEILAVLERLGGSSLPAAAHPRASPIAAAVGHARMLAAVLPSQAGQIEDLAARIGPAEPITAATTVHGDLHDGQLLSDENARITGVLDVDGAGPGERVDDLANLVGHLSSLTFSAARSAPGSARAINAYAQDLHRSFARVVDQRELDRRIAAVVLALATGPFRVQARAWRSGVHQRLTLVNRWLSRSGESTLRSAS
jgi:hypothetical protein